MLSGLKTTPIRSPTIVDKKAPFEWSFGTNAKALPVETIIELFEHK